MKFLKKYQIFFEGAKSLDAKSSGQNLKYTRSSKWAIYDRIFQDKLIFVLAGWKKNKELEDTHTTVYQRMYNLMMLTGDSAYSDKLSALKQDVSKIIKEENIDIASVLPAQSNINDMSNDNKFLSTKLDIELRKHMNKSKLFWKVMKSGMESETEAQIGSISFDSGGGRFCGKKYGIDIMAKKEPENMSDEELEKWYEENGSFYYIVRTSELPKGKQFNKIVENFIQKTQYGHNAIGNSNGYKSLEEALRILWIWIIIQEYPIKNGDIIQEELDRLVDDSSHLEKLQQEKDYNLKELINKYAHPTIGVEGKNLQYRTTIVNECEILKKLYAILGLDIEYEVLKDTSLFNQTNVSSEMLRYISISTDLQSVENSFLDILTKKLYNNPCKYTNIVWKKQEYTPDTTTKYTTGQDRSGKEIIATTKVPLTNAPGSQKRSGTQDISGILINFALPVRDEIGYRSPNVGPKSELEFNIAPTSPKNALLQILQTIQKAFSIENELVVNNTKVQDIYDILDIIKKFTNILINNSGNFSYSLENNEQLYRLLYTSLVKEGTDVSPIAAFNPDGTDRKNGLVFVKEIIKYIEDNGVAPLNNKFKEYEQKTTNIISKATKRGHKTSTDNLDDLLN